MVETLTNQAHRALSVLWFRFFRIRHDVLETVLHQVRPKEERPPFVVRHDKKRSAFVKLAACGQGGIPTTAV